MKHDLLLAGAGQLGSRYLQGMAKFAQPLDIWVLDPSTASLDRARQRWEEIAPAAAHQVHYTTHLAQLPARFDLAVLPTTADIRPGLSAEIAAHASVANWVFEKVLAQDQAGLQSLQSSVGSGHAWVNTPMHMWSLYSQLRARFGAEPVHASFTGFRGLACNAIHYIDFISRWNNAEVSAVDTSELQPAWYPAKRDGFQEIEGALSVSFADGSTLRLASGGGGDEYQVRLNCAGQQWQVVEPKGYATSGDGERIEGTAEFQSALTAPLLAAIFNDPASCRLPTLTQSVQQHQQFISALLGHWTSTGHSGLTLPIT